MDGGARQVGDCWGRLRMGSADGCKLFSASDASRFSSREAVSERVRSRFGSSRPRLYRSEGPHTGTQ